MQLPGEGRTWLEQHDGATVEDGVRNTIGPLAYWIKQRIVPEPSQDKPTREISKLNGKDAFVVWWARETQSLLFGEMVVNGADTLPDLEALRARVTQHCPALNVLEEDWVGRLSSKMHPFERHALATFI